MNTSNNNPFLKKANPPQPSLQPSQPFYPQATQPIPQPFSQQSPKAEYAIPEMPSIQTGNAMFDMAFNETSSIVKNKLQSYAPEATGIWNGFKKYFQVSNRYVVSKLRVLLFPFGSKSWKRMIERNVDGKETYLLPRQDVNAPDLYIPLMAIFTYIVITGLMQGTKGTFSPAVISTSLTSCFIAIALEMMAILLVLYLISCSASILDILSLVSYKFVGLCINNIVHLFTNRIGYSISLLYTGICMIVFTLHTLNSYIKKDEERKRMKFRNYFVIVVSGMQIVLMWLMGKYMS